MKSAVEVAQAVEAVKRLERDLESRDAQWFRALGTLVPFVRNETVDAMYSAMSARLKECFLSGARLQFSAFDAIVAEEGADPTGWIALREWLYRQPFALDASLPLPSPAEVKELYEVGTLERILPHFATKSVEDVLAALPPGWGKTYLRGFARGMRPGIDVIVATCRAHGQDPTPFVKLMEWEAGTKRTDGGG